MKKPLFPLQYESEQQWIPFDYVERGAEKCAHILPEEIENEDLRNLFLATKGGSLKDTLKWLYLNSKNFAPTTLLTEITAQGNYQFRKGDGESLYQAIIVSRPLHTIYELDKFLSNASNVMELGGHIFCTSRTSAIKEALIKKKYPWGIRSIVMAFHYLWHRVCPKLMVTKKLYFLVSKGKNRTFNRVEILGRLYRAGFEIRYEGTTHGEFFVLARKFRAPITDDIPSGAPIIKLNRVGKNGKMIGVYKFRTMYSYSEYIQSYVYEYHHLGEGGKFKDDYRVNFWGRLLRATWLDEFPMIVNMLKGQMKLVGVRPLSPHYLSLYTPEMQALHTSVKPGLLPPFYFEPHRPKSLEDIQASERRYIEAYQKHPFRTDWHYFWGILCNILIKRAHSA